MKKVCVDTNMLIWHLKRQATKGQEGNIEKSDRLFAYFQKKGIIIVVPSLVVGELMCNVTDEDERERIFDFISSHFEIVPHDTKAARVFSRLRITLDRNTIKEHADQNNIPKCRMVNDHNICAVAIASDCNAIFSHNLKDFDKFNNGEIPIYTLDFVDTIVEDSGTESQIILDFDDEDDD